MLGGHQAKATPQRILQDMEIPRIDALIVGEAENRVRSLLKDKRNLQHMPNTWWRGKYFPMFGNSRNDKEKVELLAPDVNALPFVDRGFFTDDPYLDNGLLESAIVGSRGCPFDCSFCGAAVSANPDISIRSRTASSIVSEIELLRVKYGVRAVRFVDDLFLCNMTEMRKTFDQFGSRNLGIQWDANGRVNILDKASSQLLKLMKSSGCREIALGIETGSDRLLKHIDKRITKDQTLRVVKNLCSAGIDVKGYFILGLPTETKAEHNETLQLIRDLWNITTMLPGSFRCSVFEYRVYPGTRDWSRLVEAGYSEEILSNYESFDITDADQESSLLDRNEFGFSTGIPFGAIDLGTLRRNLTAIMKEQQQRMSA
jgi:radical SAM superfamily enzyme YgiQ (UPF0313 family)